MYTMDLEGGKRRHRKTIKKGKANNILKSWVMFVKKIQKDEKIENYKDAIKRASQRKSEWKRGMMGGMNSASSSMPTLVTDSSAPMPSSSDTSMSPATVSMTGGKRKSRKSRKSRSRK